MSVDEQIERIDGRTARGARTREAIIDALYDLLREGHGDTGARAIAERAGVSTRSVFQHFEDLETVYAEVAARQEDAINPYLAPIDPLIPIAERVDRLVAARDEMYSIIAPVRRAVNVHRTARTSPLVRNNLNRLHRAMREQVAATFPREVSGDERLLAQIDVCLSFESWDQFTSQHGLTRAAARGHLAGLVISLVAN
jgi:TetR/AcrR family transcriptional regulator of autoinduction and epiphytic fitness